MPAFLDSGEILPEQPHNLFYKTSAAYKEIEREDGERAACLERERQDSAARLIQARARGAAARKQCVALEEQAGRPPKAQVVQARARVVRDTDNRWVGEPEASAPDDASGDDGHAPSARSGPRSRTGSSVAAGGAKRDSQRQSQRQSQLSLGGPPSAASRRRSSEQQRHSQPSLGGTASSRQSAASRRRSSQPPLAEPHPEPQPEEESMLLKSDDIQYKAASTRSSIFEPLPGDMSIDEADDPKNTSFWSQATSATARRPRLKQNSKVTQYARQKAPESAALRLLGETRQQAAHLAVVPPALSSSAKPYGTGGRPGSNFSSTETVKASAHERAAARLSPPSTGAGPRAELSRELAEDSTQTLYSKLADKEAFLSMALDRELVLGRRGLVAERRRQRARENSQAKLRSTPTRDTHAHVHHHVHYGAGDVPPESSLPALHGGLPDGLRRAASASALRGDEHKGRPGSGGGRGARRAADPLGTSLPQLPGGLLGAEVDEEAETPRSAPLQRSPPDVVSQRARLAMA